MTTTIFRKRSWAAITAAAVIAALAPATAFAANPPVEGPFTPPSKDINKTVKFEGCIQDGSFTLPTDFGGSIGDKFACPDDTGNDSNYTPGSLSGWNELDFVPFFLKMENTSKSPTAFNMIIAADESFKGTPGYSDISAPEIFRSSTPRCAVSSTDVKVTGPVTGGTDNVLYRVLSINMPAKSTCQFEWYNTVALGASGIPGKSLQAYVFDQADFKGGKRTISLGVDLPQQLKKTMSAISGSTSMWTVKKEPTPNTLTFDTCQPNNTQADVNIKVSWTKTPATTPGAVNITTTITATNTAARPVDVQINDKIYATETNALIDDWTSPKKTIPAKSSFDFVHTYAWTGKTPDVSNLNDVATATYFAPNGTAYSGNTTAEASARIIDVPSADSAVITDSEKLQGVNGDPLPAGVQFSTGIPAPVAGSFTGYTPGTKTTGPVNWASAAQTASGNTTFPKTVYVPAGLVGSAQLVDTASVLLGQTVAASADASVNIQVTTNATLTIEKTIPDILSGDESETFTFDVLNREGVVVADDVPITFTAGETQENATVSGLLPDMYTVQENEVPAGWNPAAEPQTVDLTGTTCAGTAPFTNSITPATATAVKVTDPVGSEGGWAMTLTPSGDAQPQTVVTDASGQAAFGELAEGSYSITETMQDGWESAGKSGDCEFTVDYPRDAGKAFTCTLTNRKLAPPPPQTGSVSIVKEFNPQTSGFTGTFQIAYTCVDGTTTVASGTAEVGNGQSKTIPDLPVGSTCTVTEPTLPSPPSGWTFNAPTFVPANGQVTVAPNATVSVRVINSISQVSPVVVKKVCPIEPVLVKKVKKDGNRILIKKIKTNKSSCVLLKPVVLCKPLGSSAAGETAFCDISVTKRGRVTVNSRGYDAVKVTVVVRTKPKPGFADRWKPNTWRKSWVLR